MEVPSQPLEKEITRAEGAAIGGAEKMSRRLPAAQDSSLRFALFVCPSGPDEGPLVTALELTGYVVIPAYSFADAQRCLGRHPNVELLVCPGLIREVPWARLKGALPRYCGVILTLPTGAAPAAHTEQAVLAQVRQPCAQESLRILVCLLLDARKRVAERKRHSTEWQAVAGAVAR